MIFYNKSTWTLVYTNYQYPIEWYEQISDDYVNTINNEKNNLLAIKYKELLTEQK